MVNEPLTADAVLSECAHDLADAAAAAVLPYFRVPLAVDNKAGGRNFDPVTAADRAAEESISALLAERFPDHGMLGEEFGARKPEARYQWVVDPIDGTRAFISGSPLWGTLIGLKDAGRPHLGVMDQPFTGERFWSDGTQSFGRWPGAAAHAIRTRPCARLSDATLMTTDPGLFDKKSERPAFDRIRKAARMTRLGGDCYSYCLLASGFVDVVIEVGLKSYDVLALIPIVEHAGGRFTTWEGGSAAEGGRIVASGDPQVHEAVLEILAGNLAGKK
ncbi:MAG: histidinol-phosphatase [Hyphomicrobium sp.]|nr:histidinol-phosphatase [Hyphomicrobium sp.]